MGKPKLFFDSSALFAGIVSPSGAARALLLMGEAGLITIVVSHQVLEETERNVAKKIPRALPFYRSALSGGFIQVVSDPPLEEVTKHRDIILHEPDVPIVVAAMRAQVDYLVTLNRKHFIEDESVAKKSGLRIGTPGDALAWVRKCLESSGGENGL